MKHKPRISLEQGVIIRVDYPDLIKVRLHQQSNWSGNLIASLGDEKKRRVIPIYIQVQDSEVIGTGILAEDVNYSSRQAIKTGVVYEAEIPNDEDNSNHHQPPGDLIGLVTSGTHISKIYFETWKPEKLKQGIMVYCSIQDQKVYYQIIDATTTEESFERHRHGFQIVEAHQLGTFHQGEGFKKFTWLPQMNTPVFISTETQQYNTPELHCSDMSIGTIPGSKYEIICDINEMIQHHTAILGVTGSGKTELAFRIIQKAIDNEVKVFCVDITGQYIERLSRFSPTELSINEELADKLGKKLHEVETGKYGASDEKKELKAFEDELREDIDNKVKEFMDGKNSIGIFTMPSISNTKATILATEIYLSSIFKYGRDTKEKKQQILVVLEEAHTVIPESSTMGLGDYDSRGMVAKIAQIALQGRKYDVGLLVIAQRTATVSKTVLTQCNTVISFSSFDQTGLAFLSNIYGQEHTSQISNLPFRQALIFGKGVKSQRPVVVELPLIKFEQEDIP